MGNLMKLAVYNPAILSDPDFLAGFVARNDLAEALLNRLREITSTGLAKHHLILGQRGMGKTSLLRRLALGIRDDAQLSATLLPLTFREEQYNIHNLHIFWMNCLDALGDWFERSGQPDKAEALDSEVAALAGGDSEGDAALSAFKRFTKAEGRRPLLLLDNIDLILDGLGDQDWSLRRVLQEAGGIVVVGAAAGYLEATTDPKAPFYDFFQVTVLERLGQEELLACLRRLAEARAEEGKKVREIIAKDPGRIRTLYDLTGGNPRTLVLLYLLLELDAEGDVMSDLERLLDQVTVLYKARVEDLASQARVILDALALNWDPATAADVARLTGLETPAASAQLDRLLKAGVVEKVSISKSNRTAFQLGERFFNIWYLMRHGPRRQRTRLRWLTGFLRGFYSPEQLRERGKALLLHADSCAVDYDYRLALGEAVEEPGLRLLLSQSAREGMERFAVASGKRLEDMTDPGELPQPKTAADWLSIGWLHEELGRYIQAEGAYHHAIQLDPRSSWSWILLGALLYLHLQRHEEAMIACRNAIELEPGNAHAWLILGSLAVTLNQSDEAESAFRKAIELSPKDANLWKIHGLLLFRLGRHAEAEVAFRQTLEFDSSDAEAWRILGDLLSNYLGQMEEAETAYVQATQLNPQDTRTWLNLGTLLSVFTGRYHDAETNFRKAVELDPENAQAWKALGGFMLYFKGDLREAKFSYEEALKFEKGNWGAESHLLALQLLDSVCLPEAVFEEIASRNPSHEGFLILAMHALTRNNIGQAQEFLKLAFSTEGQNIISGGLAFFLLFIRLAAQLKYGDKLLSWIDEQGLGDHYWPLRTAIDAYLHGEELLMDVNPEVRGVAKMIFDWLDAPRRLVPATRKISNTRRKRGSK